MKKSIITLGIIALISGAFLNAQVGVNTETPKATLDVVAGKTDGSTAEGMIVPRMTLAQLNAAQAKYTAEQTAAMVYITDATGTTITGYSDLVTCIGFVYWSGDHWIADCPYAAVQPKAFSFYEQGTEMPVPLIFIVEGNSPMNYQWYKVISNSDVRIAQECTAADGTGFASANFTPDVIKGTTRNANNTGFYRYYCVAKNATDSVESIVAEVAVGCGAKTTTGEWLSFMCFNLGATQMTIAEQRNTSLTFTPARGVNASHYYIIGEEQKYGDLYQWGRIRDGHEQRKTATGFVDGSIIAANQASYSSANPPTYESGNLIGAQRYPHIQIDRNDVRYYGKFMATLGSAIHVDWASPAIGKVGTNIEETSVTQGEIDLLWRNGRFEANDPCAKIKEDGINYETFYPEENGISGASTNWKTPSQAEWGEIYSGGALSGSPGNALSNTWTWYIGTSEIRGYDVKPDGTTITLHLPANGDRDSYDGHLYGQGSQGGIGRYWSTTSTNFNAYSITLTSGNVNPATSSFRGYGFGLRCIRNM